MKSDPIAMNDKKSTFSRLECQYITQPCGIAVASPVLSWQGTPGRVRICDEKGIEVFDSIETVTSPFHPEWLPQAQSRYFWSVTSEDGGEAKSWFESAYDDDFSWYPAVWINDPYVSGELKQPTTVFVREFDLPEMPEGFTARLYIGALGVYSARLNGTLVSDAILAPGAMNFSKYTLYQSYPVEQLLKKGQNKLEIELGSGWHSGAIARAGDNYSRMFYAEPDSIIVRLEIKRSADAGFELLLASDSSWQAFSQGSRRYSDIFMGEAYDATLSCGEASPGIAENIFDIKLLPGCNPPVRRIMELAPISITERAEKVFIVDFGQNLAGREKITFNAPRGTIVTIQHGEMLHDNGELYVENLRNAKAETVITAPGGEFTFEPEFTFYGFRYIKVSGLSDFKVCAVVLHSDLELTGSFDCSNSLLNKFMQNVLWSQRSNFLDIPTDCPQRDERQGWTADAQVFAPTALFNMHAGAFFRKYLHDLRSSALSDGRLPIVTPCYPFGALKYSFAVSGWSDAAVVIPYLLYLYYGDRTFLEENASMIYKWIDWQAANSRHGLCCHSRFGDWLNQGEPTSEEFISTAYFAYGASLALKIASVLDDGNAADRMQAHLTLARNAFQAHFIDSNGELRERTQCAAAMALEFDLLNPEQIEAAVRLLVDDIHQRGDLLATGFLGTPLLLTALSRHNLTDLAYKLLEETRCPSWLYPVTQGATTIWERWNSWSEKDGFGDIGMNSFNHYAYGVAAEWVYKVAGGIMPRWDEPGFRSFTLAPCVGGSLTHLKVEFKSPAGLIVSGWQRSGNVVTYNFTVPAGTRAYLNLPDEKETILEEGSYTFQRNI